ncbi:MAG TPA: GNAT family N-acetyltransferase [Streptosporangiaceae bacterium]|nr:GNAT family N-acetyltransferase [Streptosporangiaceae bacterium]
MQLQRFDPATDAESVQAAHEIHRAGAPFDDPYEPPQSLRPFTARLTYGWTQDPTQTWLARDGDGQPIGWYLLVLPERENRHLAGVNPMVHPERRRAGLGRMLLRHAAGQAQEAGRTLLVNHARESSPGESFARAVGARRLETIEVRRVLELRGKPAEHWAAMRRQATEKAAGYSLEYWAGTIPDDKLAQVASINAAMADAPHDYAAQTWDVARVEQGRLMHIASGMHSHIVAARHDGSGDLVAMTEVEIDPLVPELGFQGITAVVPQHRGHRLGLLLKARMHEILAELEPQLARVNTGNAAGNKHMIAINEAMGYQVLDRWLSYEMDVGQALAPAPAEHAGSRAQP